MKVLDFLTFVRIVSTLPPDSELELSIQDNMFKITVTDNILFNASIKLN